MQRDGMYDRNRCGLNIVFHAEQHLNLIAVDTETHNMAVCPLGSTLYGAWPERCM